MNSQPAVSRPTSSMSATHRGPTGILFIVMIPLPAKGHVRNTWTKRFSGAEEQYELSGRPE